jgi:predicted secreted hydrolase
VKNIRWLALAALALAIVLFGFSLLEPGGSGAVSASAVLPAVSADITGFARATAPHDWQFPADYGAHPEYQTEWWYYTGNFAGEDGRRFGFQFTIFRRAITPPGSSDGSEWRSGQLYMAHFAVSDIGGGRFFHEERFSRGGAGLAGAECSPRCRVWLGDWQALALTDDGLETRITAAGEDFAIDFTVTQVKPPALQGTGGLSAKSAEPGNASHYYSLSRMPTEGVITLTGERFPITGYTWKDHEFSTSALGTQALGWDWFGLQLDDNRELMLGQIRLTDGGREPAFGGALIEADGTTRYLPSESFTIEPLASWTSPHTGAVYPAGWAITVDAGTERPLSLRIEPLMADQELHGGGIAYWEGAVRISGDATGYGYAELTGYVDALTGRF